MVIGTSSVVHPAAGKVNHAKRHGAFTVELNTEATTISADVDASLIGPAVDTLAQLDAAAPFVDSRCQTTDTIAAMRIYLACTVRGDRGGLLAGRVVHARLEQLGHEVLTSHLLDDDVERAEAALSERDIFDRDIRWLSACDVVVAEASGSSYGVGFEVGFVLGRAPATGQQVVLVYDQSRTGAVSRLIVGNCDRACTRFAYPSLTALAAFIDGHFGPGV